MTQTAVGQGNKAASWPLYRGTKELKACPLTKAEYCLLRGWPVPADEDPAERGYVVEYQDGGKANVEGFEGYVSWSPADVFERTYKLVGEDGPPHIERMRIELAQLDERCSRLVDFTLGSDSRPTFEGLPEHKRTLLRSQLCAMQTYRVILAARLDLEEQR